MSNASDNKPARIRLVGHNVQLGETVKIKGDQERHDQVLGSLEQTIREKLAEAENKIRTMLANARQEADAIVETSRQEAKTIVEQGQAELDGIRDEGFQAGYQAGHAEATAMVEAETVRLLAGAETMVNSAFEAQARVLKGFQKNALALIGHVTKQVIQEGLEKDPALLLQMLEQATASLYLSGKVKVVLGAETLENLRRFTTGSAEALERMSRFEFEADPKLGLDEAYVLSQDGNFNLTPSVQVDQLLAPLARKLPLPEADALADVQESVALKPKALAPVEIESTAASAEIPAEPAAVVEPPNAEFVSFDALAFESVAFDDDTEES